MDGTFEWVHVVAADEVDAALNHVNNEIYLRWMNAAAMAHSAALGWPVETYLKRGQGWVVRRHEIDYLRPVGSGAEILVRTWVSTLSRATSWRCYHITDKQHRALLVRAQTLWAWIDYATGRPGRIPPEVAAAFPLVPEELPSRG